MVSVSPNLKWILYPHLHPPQTQGIPEWTPESGRVHPHPSWIRQSSEDLTDLGHREVRFFAVLGDRTRELFPNVDTGKAQEACVQRGRLRQVSVRTRVGKGRPRRRHVQPLLQVSLKPGCIICRDHRIRKILLTNNYGTRLSWVSVTYNQSYNTNIMSKLKSR